MNNKNNIKIIHIKGHRKTGKTTKGKEICEFYKSKYFVIGKFDSQGSVYENSKYANYATFFEWKKKYKNEEILIVDDFGFEPCIDKDSFLCKRDHFILRSIIDENFRKENNIKWNIIIIITLTNMKSILNKYPKEIVKYIKDNTFIEHTLMK